MARTYSLTIATQQGVAYTGEVASMRAPGADGYFGVLARHAAMIAQLGVGQITLTLADRSQRIFAVTGGICEVSESGVIILADACEDAAQIDRVRAEEAARRARERLEEAKRSGEIDAARAQLALLRAINRLKVIGRSPHS